MCTADPSVTKGEANIQAQLNKLEEVKLLPLEITANRGLVNSFRILKQELKHIIILKSPSVKVPQRHE